MSEYTSEVAEWWDHEGSHHEGAPSLDELENDATELTVHAWDEQGNDFYFNTYSDDGWLPEELDAEVGDAGDYYIGGE